ncbi:Nitroreductase [Bhargavaea beijingensis]|uniref:Nitroreductase n=1 Tax=Bhargavaea beijingensis TaxID=426756 RepID=A0A1G7G292_9BACL|nr:nitroreductase [Bhargavaea beijingensis]SDE82266.1 Nitroreductase [Bhargavaea beijingensis]
MSQQQMSVRQAVIERRSIKNFNGAPVSRDDVMAVLADSRFAPNHGKREPWRFIVGAGDNLPDVQRLIREYAIPNWRDLTEEALERQSSKFTSAGAIVFAIVREDMRQKQRIEDHMAIAAFLQNAQLLAWDKGIGTCIKTPAWLDQPDFREALGAGDGERVIGMLHFGHSDTMPKPWDHTPIEEKVTFYSAPESADDTSK